VDARGRGMGKEWAEGVDDYANPSTKSQTSKQGMTPPKYEKPPFLKILIRQNEKKQRF